MGPQTITDPREDRFGHMTMFDDIAIFGRMEGTGKEPKHKGSFTRYLGLKRALRVTTGGSQVGGLPPAPGPARLRVSADLLGL